MNNLPVAVSFTPESITPQLLQGRVAVIVDLLRATSTIVRAMQSGARSVIPCLTIEEARGKRTSLPPAASVLGGERRGLRIRGFDLGNSPAEYSPEAVSGKTVVFTTTNGTKAILASRGAARIVMGCFGNLTALVEALAQFALPVHIVCAGTDGRLCGEDCLFAGGVVAACRRRGFVPDMCDEARMAESWYAAAAPHQSGVLDAMRQSVGGRNLIAIELGTDVEFCANEDWATVVPEFDAASGIIA